MKNAIVTGAGRNLGIGAEICRMLAKSGINVFFTSYDYYDKFVANICSEDYSKTLNECSSYKINAFFAVYNLTKYSEIVRLFEEAKNKMGNIDILINCACYHVFDDIFNLTEKVLENNFSINAKSVMLLCQEFYKHFLGKEGRIINFSSTQNLEPLTTEISYAISKASVPIIVSTLAPIMAEKGITINAINPGATEIGDINDKNKQEYFKCNKFFRLGLPSDAANLVQFLISDAGKWITGQVINSEGAICRGLIKDVL